jgi:hypothetical protein
MASTAHPVTPLFASLPPELRNEIYAHLSLPSTSDLAPLNTHLPLQLKTFSCKHTTTQLIPTHHGFLGLLSLPKDNFPEAAEYASHLLTNGVTIRISVHFHGRVNTFNQGDWNKKLSTHLNKLAKSFPWLRKVARYEIRILWEPVDGTLKGKRVAGQIPLDMAACLTQLMDQEVKRKRGDVKLRLCLEHRFAVQSALSDKRLGLNTFLFGNVAGEELGFSKFVREIRKTGHDFHVPENPRARFLVVPSKRAQQDKVLIEVQGGVVSWLDWTRGSLVMARTLDMDTALVGSLEQGDKEQAEFPMCHLKAECVMG